MNAPVEVSPVVDADVSTVAGVSGPISAPMVAALESAWAAIRARHPEVPVVVLVLGAGSIGNAGGLRLGHFAAMRWADPDQTNATDEDAADGTDGEPSTGQPVRLPEVFIGGEGLVRGAADVLGTLLAAGPITCGVCGADFTPDLPDQDGDGNGTDEGAGE